MLLHPMLSVSGAGSPSAPVSGTGTGFDSSPIKGEGDWWVCLAVPHPVDTALKPV